jgi:Leucine-rich repeat (LRR) protein
MPPSHPHRWHRFSLRTLLLVMSGCCLLLGGSMAYINTFRVQIQSLAAAERLQGDATVLPAAGPRWCRWVVTTVLGPDSYVEVIKLAVSQKPIDDAALQSLAGLIYLQKLDLDRTRITDVGLQTIAAMPDLMTLSLRYDHLSDRAASTLAELPNLQTLYLTGTQLTDGSVAELAKLHSLSELFIRWTGISGTGAEQLRTALPKCAVYYQPLPAEPERVALGH